MSFVLSLFAPLAWQNTVVTPLALQGTLVTPLALPSTLVTPLAFQGPDSPNGDILGWLIVFFMVVWPLLRGVIEAANERRRGHLEKEQGGAARPKGAAPRKAAGRPVGRAQPSAPEQDPFESLKRALQGQLERGTRTETSAETQQAPQRLARPRTAPAPSAADSSPPTSRIPVEKHSAPFKRKLGGDPFDERMLERALVEDPELAHVPSEGGTPTEAPSRHVMPKRKPPVDAPTPMDVHGAALAKLSRRVRTPWGLAVVYEELLGPPVSMREPRF